MGFFDCTTATPTNNPYCTLVHSSIGSFRLTMTTQWLKHPNPHTLLTAIFKQCSPNLERVEFSHLWRRLFFMAHSHLFPSTEGPLSE